jgi:phospholipase/carboxylesterase
MTQDIVVQAPAKAAQLFLLFHGYGADAPDMQPLAKRFADEFPQACVVCVQATEPAEAGFGWQWFPLQGVTEENRSQRVTEVMPAFVELIRNWQQRAGVGYEATALVGFSQGGIMSLAASLQEANLCGRVLGFSSRFVNLPVQVPETVTYHLFHGKSDNVIHYGFAVSAAERLVAIEADVTADVLPYIGHEIHPNMIDLAIERLTTHLPKRFYKQVQEADPGDSPLRH